MTDADLVANVDGTTILNDVSRERSGIAQQQVGADIDHRASIHVHQAVGTLGDGQAASRQRTDAATAIHGHATHTTDVDIAIAVFEGIAGSGDGVLVGKGIGAINIQRGIVGNGAGHAGADAGSIIADLHGTVGDGQAAGKGIGTGEGEGGTWDERGDTAGAAHIAGIGGAGVLKERDSRIVGQITSAKCAGGTAVADRDGAGAIEAATAGKVVTVEEGQAAGVALEQLGTAGNLAAAAEGIIFGGIDGDGGRLDRGRDVDERRVGADIAKGGIVALEEDVFVGAIQPVGGAGHIPGVGHPVAFPDEITRGAGDKYLDGAEGEVVRKCVNVTGRGGGEKLGGIA